MSQYDRSVSHVTFIVTISYNQEKVIEDCKTDVIIQYDYSILVL